MQVPDKKWRKSDIQCWVSWKEKKKSDIMADSISNARGPHSRFPWSLTIAAPTLPWVVVNTSFQNQQADVIFRPRYYKLSFTAQQHLQSGICCPSLLCQLNLKSKNRASSSSLCPPLRRKQQNCWILLNSPEKAWELKTAVGGRSSYTPVIASLPKGDWNSAIDAMLMTSMSLR